MFGNQAVLLEMEVSGALACRSPPDCGAKRIGTWPRVNGRFLSHGTKIFFSAVRSERALPLRAVSCSMSLSPEKVAL